MRVYLSSRFGRQHEMRGYSEQLRAEGIEVVSAWHEMDVPAVDGFSGIPRDRLAWLAMMDVQQLSGANAVAVFSDRPMPEDCAGVLYETWAAGDLCGVGGIMGSKHVEAGMALALGKRLMLVGHPENRYYDLPDVERFFSWPECFGRLLELRQDDVIGMRAAALELKVPLYKLQRWIRSGRVVAAKRAGRYVIGRNELDRLKAAANRRAAAR